MTLEMYISHHFTRLDVYDLFAICVLVSACLLVDSWSIAPVLRVTCASAPAGGSSALREFT